jgi:hypothetical protein
MVLPFDFGIAKGNPVDLFVKSFEYNPDPKVYNRLKLSIENTNTLKKSIETGYNVYVFVDRKLRFFNYCKGISEYQEQGTFYFGGETINPGRHEYVVYIDPEGLVNDINRNNNILKGSFEVK